MTILSFFLILSFPVKNSKINITASKHAKIYGLLARYRVAPIHLEKKPILNIDKKISRYIAVRGCRNARTIYIITTSAVKKMTASIVRWPLALEQLIGYFE